MGMTQPPERPIFAEVPDEVDKSYPGILVGGMARERSLESLAAAYWRAGDRLTDVARDSAVPYDYAYPIFYLYRHSLELYLKAMPRGPDEGTHPTP
jgi:hypothetical protein